MYASQSRFDLFRCVASYDVETMENGLHITIHVRRKFNESFEFRLLSGIVAQQSHASGGVHCLNHLAVDLDVSAQEDQLLPAMSVVHFSPGIVPFHHISLHVTVESKDVVLVHICMYCRYIPFTHGNTIVMGCESSDPDITAADRDCHGKNSGDWRCGKRR